ncbi:MAG TPA: hypothetical protein VI298_10630 [Geobacteraceae bacterium]
MIPLILLSAVGTGLTYFVIGELPKKIGYPRFILTCIGYTLSLAVITYAVTEGIITGAAFLIALFLPVPVGALYLRHELIQELKNPFKKR